MARYLQRLGIRLSVKLAISSIAVTSLLIIISVAIAFALASATGSINHFQILNQEIVYSTQLNFALNSAIDASQRLQQQDQPTVANRVDYYAARKPLTDAQSQLQKLTGLRADPQWQQLSGKIDELLVVLDQIATLAPTNVFKARDLWNVSAFDLGNDAKARASSFNTAILDESSHTRQDAQSGITLAASVLASLALVAVIVSILFGVLNNAVFVRPIRSIKYELERIAAGDLTHQLNVDNNDELGDLVRTFNRTVSELRGLITELKHQTGDIEGASVQVTAISRQQLAGSHEQVLALTSATQLVGEMKAAAALIDRNASSVASAARQALDSAAAGSESITANLVSMRQIEGKVYNINAEVKALNEGLTQVGRILELMDDLATDSELLSFNALIEASGAGPHSRRFAIVATELSSLAQRSKDATKEVQDIITSVQAAMRSSLDATQEGLREVARGTELSRRSEVATREIVSAVSHTVVLADSILNSTTKQHNASEQVASTIQAVNLVAANNLGTSDKAACTASRLTVIASQLRDAAGNFEVN